MPYLQFALQRHPPSPSAGGRRRQGCGKAPGAGRRQLGQPLGWDSASFKAFDVTPAEEGALVESLNHLQCVPALRSSSLAKWSQLSPLGKLNRELLRRDPAPHRQVALSQLLCSPVRCPFLHFRSISSPVSYHLTGVCVCVCACGGSRGGFVFPERNTASWFHPLHKGLSRG